MTTVNSDKADKLWNEIKELEGALSSQLWAQGTARRALQNQLTGKRFTLAACEAEIAKEGGKI